MRSRALSLGWHATSVNVGVSVWSTTHRSVGSTMIVSRDCVGVIGVGHVEDDLVAGREQVDVVERVAVRHAVTREHRVAALAR